MARAKSAQGNDGRDDGRHTVSIDVSTDWPAWIALYEDEGFAPVEIGRLG